MNKIIKISLLILIFFSLASCSKISDITKTLMNLKNLEYRLLGIESVRLAGVDFNSNMSLKDISLMNITRLTAAAAKKSMPIEFILNLEAKNPNEEKGKSFNSAATIESFDFDVFLDSKKAFTGGLASPVKIESNGGIKVIPLKVAFDLTQVYENSQYEKLANIAMNLAGFDVQKTKVAVEATPIVSTPLGKMNPGRIKITQTEY